jgi:hypothetical protein
VRLAGERLSSEHRDRREHTRGIRVASRLDRVNDRKGNFCWHLGLLQRPKQGGGELLQLSRLTQRRRVIEHRSEHRDDLLAQDL